MISYPAASLRVFGIDLSFTDTGIGDLVNGVMHRFSLCTDTHDYPSTGIGKKRRLTEVGTDRRIADIEGRILAAIGMYPQPALVALEGPSLGSSSAGTWDRGGLWWRVFGALQDQELPVAVVPPKTLKLYASGNGNASKSDMRMALYQRTSEDEANDNRVDGHFLAAAAAEHLGHPLMSLPKRQREALDKVAWPNLAAPAIAS